jgi:hypothetical protein
MRPWKQGSRSAHAARFENGHWTRLPPGRVDECGLAGTLICQSGQQISHGVQVVPGVQDHKPESPAATGQYVIANSHRK